jgi:RNA polymerase sigma factor (sigma-70 family)
MNSAAEIREEQAMACLEAAATYREPLLALATCLAGSQQEGMELYQQACLQCHDAIQAGGFQGDGYTFYLRRAIKNLHYAATRAQAKRVTLPPAEYVLPEELPEGWEPDAQERFHRQQFLAAQPEPEYSALAETVMAEARARFPFADRIALHLSLSGMSCQQIAEHIGMKDQSWVWRRLNKMKAELRRVFQPAFDALGE